MEVGRGLWFDESWAFALLVVRAGGSCGGGFLEGTDKSSVKSLRLWFVASQRLKES